MGFRASGPLSPIIKLIKNVVKQSIERFFLGDTDVVEKVPAKITYYFDVRVFWLGFVLI